MVFKWISKFKDGLKKTSSEISEGIKSVVLDKNLDDEVCEQLEELLISADMGVETSLSLVAELRKEKFDREINELQIREWLAEKISEKLMSSELAEDRFTGLLSSKSTENQKIGEPEEASETGKPSVILMVGVNGAGKTTTIGKLTHNFVSESKKVTLVAGDTFRAGAVEQLKVWGDRNKVEVVAPDREGSDPAGVVFSGYEHAKENHSDILIVDTAGRLQNRQELMDELAKITRVIKKQDENAPHGVWLVIDATVGQNAHSQVEGFQKTANVTGLIVTKLDSTAKGGVVVSLAEKFQLPILYVGIGEGIEDLKPFNAKAYSLAIMGLEESSN